MKRVLLTGASGFLGRHCVPSLLAMGYEVHAVSSVKRQTSRSDVHWHQLDLLDPSAGLGLMATLQPTHLLHLAWYTTPGLYWQSPDNLRWVAATIELLRTFAQHGGRRAVVAGTCAEYDWRYGYCSEELTPLSPATLYGTCKHSLQLILDSFSRQTGLSSAWGRIFFLYGPHEHPDRLVPSVIRSLLKPEPAECSSGDQVRDFLYVEDAADAFVALLDGDATGPINIASGQPVTIKRLVSLIAKELQHIDLVRFGAREARSDDPALILADTNRLNRGLGWIPKCDLLTGLRRTIAWWKHPHTDALREPAL